MSDELIDVDLSDDGLRPKTGVGLIHALLDQLANEFAGPMFRGEIAEAREDYFSRAGKVFEDDAEVYESRTVSFLEWYLIERPLLGGPPPVIQALSRPGAWDQRQREALVRIASSHRSLFDIAEVKDNLVELEDVLGGARFSVLERRSTIGFEVGALAEARVVWDGEAVVFAKTFLFHPRDARQEILDAVDAGLLSGTSRDDVIFRLSRLYLRWHRHGHLNAARIYKGLGSEITSGPVLI